MDGTCVASGNEILRHDTSRLRLILKVRAYSITNLQQASE
jgi:hypothetical protein